MGKLRDSLFVSREAHSRFGGQGNLELLGRRTMFGGRLVLSEKREVVPLKDQTESVQDILRRLME